MAVLKETSKVKNTQRKYNECAIKNVSVLTDYI